MEVVEQIKVNYSDNNHGILRAIPASYKGHPMNIHVESVSSTSGAPAAYKISSSNGNEVLKIGNPNQTVTGTQAYTIKYSEQNVITFYNDHDELYWDVNGDQWDQPFLAVQATLHLPAGLRLASQRPKCFVGSFGSTSQQCQIVVSPQTINTTAFNLQSQSTLTFVVGFQKGYFHPMTWTDWLHDYAVPILEFFVPFLLLSGGGFVWWFKRGRDAKGRGTIIPEYDAPDGLKPIEVGALIDFVVDNRDLTATIIDLAIRKYIRIIESEDKRLLVMKKKAYTLELLNADWSALNHWEVDILNGLFGSGSKIGDQIDVAALATKLSSVAKNAKQSVGVSLTDRGYFVSNPSRRVTLSISVIVLFIWLFLSFSNGLAGWLVAGLALGFIVFSIFYHLLPARTAKGVTAKEHILGLKMYMEVAEKARIAKLQSPDAPYAEKSDAPQQTVDLFEKLLPFAIVLKVEQQWAKKFEGIYKAPPDWYSGNFATFNAVYLASSLNSGFAPAVGSSFNAPRSSGGSGFAGGGGGGGGGGGW